MRSDKEAMKKPLTKIEKDRVIVLFISFLLVIVFWGAFEQAGGLMNIYASEKTNRMLMGWEVPAILVSIFKCHIYYIFGNSCSCILGQKKIKRKRFLHLLFKMVIGLIIMGTGFFFMTAAAAQYES